MTKVKVPLVADKAPEKTNKVPVKLMPDALDAVNAPNVAMPVPADCTIVAADMAPAFTSAALLIVNVVTGVVPPIVLDKTMLPLVFKVRVFAPFTVPLKVTVPDPVPTLVAPPKVTALPTVKAEFVVV